MAEETTYRREPDPVFEQKITFADDTVLPGRGSLNETNDDLWMWPENAMSVAEAVAIFDDSKKTEKIRVDYSAIEHREFEGYTQITTIQTNVAGKISVRLRKPE